MAELAMKLSEMGSVQNVPVETLRVTESPRSSGENAEHIRMLAGVLDELPPIIVHRRSMRVVDGVHRLRAAQLRGLPEIEVRFFDGDDSDAFVLAVRANVAHGMPLSLADRKAAAARIVASHSHWSDRMIATVAGLSAATVARIRLHRADPGPPSRIGHDGRVRPVNGSERRQLARSLLQTEPTLSLREVARRVGISPETARSVRGRLRDSEPEPSPAAKSRQHPGTVARHLRNDPALRFSEAGRELLRLLDAHTITAERWAVLADSVPPYCHDSVARVALECARAWQDFAKQLEQPAESSPQASRRSHGDRADRAVSAAWRG
jgi:ParB-like chromosome segregation protein Spo0J